MHQAEKRGGSLFNINNIWPEWHQDDLIGQGSYGKVYRISRTDDIGMVAAAKVIEVRDDPIRTQELRTQGMDERSIRSYYQNVVDDVIKEIQTMTSLRGARNIVNIEDYKLCENPEGDGSTIVIRMELLDCLSDQVRNGTRLSPREVARVGSDICNALARCEQEGIIHRDIKPQNIFRTQDGDYKLGDFGVARLKQTASRTMSTKGTIRYMAPEAFTQGHYDNRADIYSLGLVLYELLNNMRGPFLPTYDNLTPSIEYEADKRRIRGDIPPAPADGDDELSRIVLKACNPDPSERYASANNMKADLQAWLSSTTPPPDPPLYEDPNSITREVDDKTKEDLFGKGGSTGFKGQTPPIGSTPTSVDPPIPPPPPWRKYLAIILICLAAVVLGVLAGIGAGRCTGPDISPDPEVAVKASANEYTWEELAQISDGISAANNDDEAIELAKKYNLCNQDGTLDGTQVKDIALMNGINTQVQIVGFNHDDTEAGKAGISFIFRDCVAEHWMNPKQKNAGGWEASEMREWLNTTFVSDLPSDLAAVIVPAQKRTNNAGKSDSVESAAATTDALWLPSACEVSGNADWEGAQISNDIMNNEGQEYQLYRDMSVNPEATNAILTKRYLPANHEGSWCIPGDACFWWTRSPDSTRDSAFHDVHSDGSQNGTGGYADHLIGVAPGFCIGKNTETPSE